MSSKCGRRIVDLVWKDLTPNQILTDAAFQNADIIAMVVPALMTRAAPRQDFLSVATAKRQGFELFTYFFPARNTRAGLAPTEPTSFEITIYSRQTKSSVSSNTA